MSQAPRPGARLRLPISWTLLLGFGGLVAAAVAAVLLISIRVAQENTDQLMEQMAVSVLDSATARIDRYLSPVADDVRFLAGQIGDPRVVDIGDDRQIETLMRGSLGPAPQIDAIVFLRSDLSSVRMRRDGSRRIDSISGRMSNRTYVLELMERARRLTGVGWNDVFYVKELGVSFISAMAPVLREGEFRGFVIAAVPVGELSRLIDRPQRIGTMFILDANDGVVAHPLLAEGRFVPTPDHVQLRREEIADPVLRALWSSSDRRLGTRFAARSVQARRVEAGGESYIVLLQTLQDFSAQPWFAGIYFHATAVMGPLTQLQHAFAAGILILALAVASALLLGRSLARPIKRLAAAAEAVSAFDFSGSRRPGVSPFRELDTAGQAWDSMLAALRWFETYVPKALVGRLLQLSSKSELAAEEREVTVMFTDIVGFSRIAGRHTPASLAAFLNRHFALIGRHVEAEGGTIDKYVGDSVMAFWGAPSPDPDHARHAVRAACAIAETLAADNRRRARKGLTPVRIRIGLHSGPAVVGNVGAPGRVNYTLIGDTVNAAQRLEQLGHQFDDGAADCVVLASAAVMAALGGEVPCRPLGRQALRGVGVFEVYRLGEPPQPALQAGAAS